MNGSKVLLALDGSPETAHAVAHVARMVQAGKIAMVALGYVLRPIPPALLEHAGGDTPQEEREKQARLDGERETWVRSEQRAAQAPLQRARSELRRAGLADDNIPEKFITIVHDTDIAQNLLDTARVLGCQIIVVAREAFAWYRERHAVDIADHLQRDAGDETVIAVGKQGEPTEIGYLHEQHGERP